MAATTRGGSRVAWVWACASRGLVRKACTYDVASGRPDRAGCTSPLPCMRILYVEDNLDLRETVAILMEGEGRTVVACATAEEALELDVPEPFDVLVADARLPGMSGSDLARHVLARDPQRWVLLCSGYDLGRYPMEWGPHVRTLVKPFDPDHLERLLVTIEESLRGTAVRAP